MTETTETTDTPAASEAAPTPEAALAEITSQVVAEINKGSLTFADLLKALSPQQQSEPVPAVIPTPKAITPKQTAAMEKVSDVYGKVVPTERRALAPVEIGSLIEEKQTLDEVKKMATSRLEDVTVTIHNHLNVVLEEAGQTDGVLLDGKGNYIAEGRAGSPDHEQEFAREVKNYAASLDEAGLKNAEALGMLSHEDYLAMTRQVRVVDETRVMALLSKKPEVLRAIQFATVPGKKGTAVALRKRK